jgi:hypothetical protein
MRAAEVAQAFYPEDLNRATCEFCALLAFSPQVHDSLSITRRACATSRIWAGASGFHEPRITIHGSSSLSSSEAARGVLADFSFFIRELGALLAEFLATTVFQLGNENDV